MLKILNTSASHLRKILTPAARDERVMAVNSAKLREAREKLLAKRFRERITSYRAAEIGSWVENNWQSYPSAQKRNGGLRGSKATRSR